MAADPETYILILIAIWSAGSYGPSALKLICCLIWQGQLGQWGVMARRPYNNNFVMNFWGGGGCGMPPHNKLYFGFYKEEGCVEISRK